MRIKPGRTPDVCEVDRKELGVLVRSLKLLSSERNVEYAADAYESMANLLESGMPADAAARLARENAAFIRAASEDGGDE